MAATDGTGQAEKTAVPQKLLFTTTETARLLGISTRTLFKLIQEKRILPTWLGPRSKRFTPAAIEAFIASSQQRRAG